MTKSPARAIRCAVYTRKSTEEGLDQAFNSLDAQREACEAYVKSQAGEGWKVLPAVYNDGGFSGGNMSRPALERLLADVDAGRVDVIVVYKVDRLTRSLADFAKIVERLDAAGASFVSVTQAFNTTNSMGRLTLNVLLSFAQFEREVTSERIRDKIAASKAKGMWMGGGLPLGYDAPTDPNTRALVVNPAEAETVRHVFQTYLELGSVHALATRLEQEGIRSKRRTTRTGRQIGGARLARGALFHLLKNRVYVGEITHCDKSFPGAHEPIIDAELFDAVQKQLEAHRQAWTTRPIKAAQMPLRGKLFDIDGTPMCPSFTRGKGGQVYRYYVSATLQTGRPASANPRAVHRLAAPEIETIVREEISRLLGLKGGADGDDLIGRVERIEVESDALRITLRKSQVPIAARARFHETDGDNSLLCAEVAVRSRRRGGRTWIVPSNRPLTDRVRKDGTLIRGLQKAHRLAKEMGWRPDGSVADGDVTAPANAYDRKLCRLAFLAPDIQSAILAGRQPPGVNLELLVSMDLADAWTAQRAQLGIAA